jgi:hypothetical protein
MSAEGVAQMSQLTELRKMRLRREEEARQAASNELVRTQRAHQAAIEAVTHADAEYTDKVAHTYRRFNRGGVSAMNMVGAMRDFDVVKEKVRQLERVVEAKEKDVDRADASLREAQGRVRKAEMKVDVSDTLHRKQKEALNLTREIVMEDETDEITLLRKSGIGV